jgi:hypothetical protein
MIGGEESYGAGRSGAGRELDRVSGGAPKAALEVWLPGRAV